MPPLRTYTDGKNIYSVDMMLAYINTHGHPVEKLLVEEFIPQLSQKVWGNWSPMTVIKRMDAKKYASNSERIQKADLSYPIIVTGKQTSATRTHSIVDGYHRLAKALLDDTKEIKVHVFDQSLMNKFILDKNMNFVKVHQDMSVSDILEIWSKRF